MGAAKKYNKNFFKAWNRNVAYILGFIYADGNIVETKRGNHYIAIYTADRALLAQIRSIMQSEHKISMRNERSGNVYRIQVGSKEWFKDLLTLGITPNKSKRMILPIIPMKFIGDFIRGYFDGDGNVWCGFVHKNRITSLKTLQVAFTSCSIMYLQALHKALKELGIIGGSLYIPREENFARLAFSARDALKLYNIMYNTPHELYLKRKKVVFEQFMKCGRSSTG